MEDDKDPYEDEAHQLDKEPVPGLGDTTDDDVDGMVCTPADLVTE
jgi:hypothetical protein